MRERIVETLPPTAHREFLVYVMGPYKAFELADVVGEDVDPEELRVPFGRWDETAGEYTEAEAFDLLRRVSDRLREEAGLNAFLAVDAEIELEEMDAATQSVEFARASNVVAFVAPTVGKNLGVGIEVGSVLESLDDEGRERVVFVHEKGVRSAMIAALSRRWEAAVYSYADEDELVRRIRTFAADVMNREFVGDLEPPR